MMVLCKLSGTLIENVKLALCPKKIVSGEAYVMKQRKEVNKKSKQARKTFFTICLIFIGLVTP